LAEARATYEVARPATKEELARLVKELESQMKTAARNLEFEKAALIRDRLIELRRTQIEEEQEMVKKAINPRA
jgi:excinuclease ABC subunit B